MDYSLASSPQGGLLAAPPLFRSTFIAAPPGYKLGPGHVPVLDHRNSHFPGSLRSKKTFTNMDDATLDNIAMHKRILVNRSMRTAIRILGLQPAKVHSHTHQL